MNSQTETVGRNWVIKDEHHHLDFEIVAGEGLDPMDTNPWTPCVLFLKTSQKKIQKFQISVQKDRLNISRHDRMLNRYFLLY